MTLLNKVLRYFNKKKDQNEIEVTTYDSSKDDHYFESFDSIIIENSFKGTIVCLGDIHIKKDASFSGEMICRTCKIEGSFNGSLLSAEYAGVCNTAVLDAKIIAASIFIENNATVKGTFNITKDIIYPEPYQKLNAAYSQSLPLIDEIQNAPSNNVKRIVLQGKSLKPIHSDALSKPETPEIEMKRQDVPVKTADHLSEIGVNRSKDISEPNSNSGWW